MSDHLSQALHVLWMVPHVLWPWLLLFVLVLILRALRDIERLLRGRGDE